MTRLILCSALSAIFFPSITLANGFEESGSWAFRTPAERQILLQGEQTRLNYMIFDFNQRSAGAAGAGGQIGNSLSIIINGDGDNVIDTSQDNTGDQSVQEATGGGGNQITENPNAAIAAAAARLTTLQSGTE
ncbi:hypothetical protein [Sulfitobacter sp. PS-8MA]|uniref:hypothetical protein n=1 Tax=Sulfitobacter sp. PS-8MA TaxID=3237707 RepID=UPI0034C60EE5